ncbi:glycoside hydrolase family 127 protein [Olivibacter sp. XZL3]|uniref:glycoside hydrolase family 127 protein n=1 Tax=Olivibacter sp. XZL3 TaxID=1735116 RepID=UPI001F0D33F5|nr:glycoside hydrolase family 127 protein [Olivibacter sp. XZL3]
MKIMTTVLRLKQIVAFSFFCLSLGIPTRSWTQEAKMELFPLASIRLGDGPLKEAQEVDLHYILALNPDRLLAPYLSEAGLEPKAERYGNWENTGLDGHIGGHYLSALSLMAAATGNQAIQDRLAYMLSELKRCQDEDSEGYLGGIPGGKQMWNDIKRGKIEAQSFSLNGKWVPIYNIHKLFAGLIDAYRYTGNEQSRQMVLRLGNWWLSVFDGLTDEQIQTILRSEHGGINEAFADLAQISGDQKYLRMAERLSHRAILQPLMAGKDELTGLHANTQIPKVIGFEKIAALADSLAWVDAARFFWETVVERRTVSIGGNSESEHFHALNSFGKMLSSREGPETCNTYNMMKLSKDLFLLDPERRFIDYYERATYNHILSSQHPSEGGFVYFTPMRPNHYRVYSQAQACFWCCVGSGLENHGKYGELIYSHSGADLYVNLFIPSTLKWPQQGISLQQNTAFPYGQKSEITIEVVKPKAFSVFIRKPNWLGEKSINLLVNGRKISYQETKGYWEINRTWAGKSIITFDLPMEIKAELLPSGEPWVSYTYGPIVLASKNGTEDLKGLFADDKRMGHIAAGALLPTDANPILVSENGALSQHAKVLDANRLLFELSHLHQKGKATKATLQPFFSIHDARYTVYWRTADTRSLDSITKAARQREEAQLKLDKQTVDVVSLGEQQPESDHHMQQEDSYTGVLGDYHWRAARGWFSYEMNNKGRQSKTISIKHEHDTGACYELWINDKRLSLTDQAKDSEGIDISSFNLEKADVVQDKLRVKIKACNEKTTGKILEIRLLK